MTFDVICFMMMIVIIVLHNLYLSISKGFKFLIIHNSLVSPYRFADKH